MIKKIYAGYGGCAFYGLEFPNGNKVTIDIRNPYVTSDPDEIAYANAERFLTVADPNAQEVHNYMYDPRNIPSILKDITKEGNFAASYKFRADEEEAIKIFFSKLGYSLTKNEEPEIIPEANNVPEVAESVIERTAEEAVKKHSDSGEVKAGSVVETETTEEILPEISEGIASAIDEAPKATETIVEAPVKKPKLKELKDLARERNIDTKGKGYEELYKLIYG